MKRREFMILEKEEEERGYGTEGRGGREGMVFIALQVLRKKRRKRKRRIKRCVCSCVCL